MGDRTEAIRRSLKPGNGCLLTPGGMKSDLHWLLAEHERLTTENSDLVEEYNEEQDAHRDTKMQHEAALERIKELLAEVQRIRKAAEAFMAQYNVVAESDEWKGVWTFLHIHGNMYSGPEFGDELEALELALASDSGKQNQGARDGNKGRSGDSGSELTADPAPASDDSRQCPCELGHPTLCSKHWPGIAKEIYPDDQETGD